MKSIITNYGKSLAIESFQNIITKYALIGTTTKDDQTLVDILNKDSTILENLNIINRNPTNILTKYIISDAGIIDSKMIDNKLRLLFQINLDESKMPIKKFVYAIALADDSGEVYSVSSFAESFNALKDATETIKIIHNIINPENMEENLTYVKDGDFFITRDEMSSFINNHTHKELVNKIELNNSINALDDKKVDKVILGDLNDVNSINKTSVVSIFNEIINKIGNLDQLTTTEKTSIVSSINELKSKIGDIPNSIHNSGPDQFIYTDVKDGLDKLFQKIKDIPEPHFKDGFNTKDVNWNDKADVRFIGDLDSFHGNTRESIMAAINEIFDLVGVRYLFHTLTNLEIVKGNWLLYDGSTDYKGSIYIKAYRSGKEVIKATLDIDTYKSYYLKIKDVLFSDDIKNMQLMVNSDISGLNSNYVFGFSICYDETNKKLYLSILTNKNSQNEIIYDKLELNYGPMDSKSLFIKEAFNNANSVPLIENAGHYFNISSNEIELSFFSTIKNTYYRIFKHNSPFKGMLKFYKNDSMLGYCDISYFEGMKEPLINNVQLFTENELLYYKSDENEIGLNFYYNINRDMNIDGFIIKRSSTSQITKIVISLDLDITYKNLSLKEDIKEVDGFYYGDTFYGNKISELFSPANIENKEDYWSSDKICCLFSNNNILYTSNTYGNYVSDANINTSSVISISYNRSTHTYKLLDANQEIISNLENTTNSLDFWLSVELHHGNNQSGDYILLGSIQSNQNVENVTENLDLHDGRFIIKSDEEFIYKPFGNSTLEEVLVNFGYDIKTADMTHIQIYMSNKNSSKTDFTFTPKYNQALYNKIKTLPIFDSYLDSMILPVGYIMPVFKTNEYNKNRLSSYLKMDGSLIPNHAKYSKLRNLLGNSSNLPKIEEVVYGSSIDNTDPNIQNFQNSHYSLSRKIESNFYNIPAIPVAFDNKNIIKILNSIFKDLNLRSDFPVETFFSSEFSNSSRENAYKPFIYIHEGPSFSDPNSTKGLDSLSRLKHVSMEYMTLQIRKSTKNYADGTRHYLWIGIGQNPSPTSVYDNDLELPLLIDQGYMDNLSGVLLYIEIGDKNAHKKVYSSVVLIPKNFIYPDYHNSSNDLLTEYAKISEYYNAKELKLQTLDYNFPELSNYGGFNQTDPALYDNKSCILNFNTSINGTSNYIYIKAIGVNDGNTSKAIQGEQINLNTAFIPFDPNNNYTYAWNPFSLYQMISKNLIKYGSYYNMNNIYSVTSNTDIYNTNVSKTGSINRFSIDTSSLLDIVGLGNLYTYDQFDRFWDSLFVASSHISYRYKELQSSGNSSYPKLGGINVEKMTTTPNNNSICGGKFNPGSKGEIYGFQNEISFNEQNSDKYHIIGSRAIILLKDTNNITIKIDTDTSRETTRGGRGFMIYQKDQWVDLYNYLIRYTSGANNYDKPSYSPWEPYDSNEVINMHSLYPPHTLASPIIPPDSPLPNDIPIIHYPVMKNGKISDPFQWKNISTQSAGVCRIRIYVYGEDKPVVDKIFAEFASNKDYADNKGGSAIGELQIGNFDWLNDNENIINNFNTPGSPIQDYVLVIDRFAGGFVANHQSQSALPYVRDSWDCFDMNLFIDWVNNDESFWFNNIDRKLYLPDMTKSGTFLGGGPDSGVFINQSLPNIKGTFTAAFQWASRYTDGAFRRDGPSYGQELSVNTSQPSVTFEASRSSSIYQDNANVQPNHYAVDWYIKY